MKKIPAFVRGMVVRAVEESCRKSGLDRVTVEELERIRARMPTPKIFGSEQRWPWHLPAARRIDGTHHRTLDRSRAVSASCAVLV